MNVPLSLSDSEYGAKMLEVFDCSIVPITVDSHVIVIFCQECRSDVFKCHVVLTGLLVNEVAEHIFCMAVSSVGVFLDLDSDTNSCSL